MLRILKPLGCAKIYKFNLECLFIVDEYVLWLEVSVAHFHAVTVLDGRNELSYHNGSIPFVKFSSCDDFIKQLTALAIFGHKIYVLLIFEYFVKS